MGRAAAPCAGETGVAAPLHLPSPGMPTPPRAWRRRRTGPSASGTAVIPDLGAGSDVRHRQDDEGPGTKAQAGREPAAWAFVLERSAEHLHASARRSRLHGPGKPCHHWNTATTARLRQRRCRSRPGGRSPWGGLFEPTTAIGGLGEFSVRSVPVLQFGDSTVALLYFLVVPL